MVKERISMGLSIEDIYESYKLVADGIVDDESFQQADTGILLSSLYDVVNVLEKQIPKKAKYDGYFGFNSWNCPTCGEDVTNKPNFCPNCGQKLDWSK